MTIALHVLREMNHSMLADTLEKGVLGELATCQNKLKRNLKRKSQYLFEGIAEQGNHTLLNDIYTDLQMIEGGPGDVNDEHEVRQIESKKRRPESAIKSSDIFLPLKGRTERVRNVLTVGIAGIGKTVCVQKFTLDWIEGTANQKVHLIFPLSFRQLNLVKDRQFSFLELLQHFFVEVKESGIEDFDKYTIVIILDGLDESRLTLNFEGSKTCKDIRESASLDVLITSLIEGNLLPSAGVWITSRPAAANQIPPKYVDQLTEVRGFNDPQKEEYFVKRICNKTLAVKISKHMKTSRSFHIMCHIPFFCWISATVLENILYETMTRQTKALSAAQSDALTQTEGTPMTVQSQKEMASTKDEGPTGKGSKMTSELEVFDLKKYSRLNGCNLSERSYKAIATTLCSKSSLLRKLDLSDNGLNLSGIANLAVGLGSQVCKLESLRLNRCTLDERCCERLALVLSSNSSLRELDLSDNDLQDLGVKLLCGGLEKRQCMLETLKLSFCGITKEGCSYLVSAIESNPSHLKELDLSYNNLGEAGKRLLTAVKENPLNEVEKLSIDHDAECWLKSGLKAFHRELTLSEDSRTVLKRELQVYPDHPERFESCGQVLCQQSMTGRYYWEVEWSRSAGDLAAYVGVAYKRIKRKGGEFQSLLGRNDDSWSIRCASDNYMAWHSRKNTIIPVPSVYSNRLGLYLDWPNGTLSFYSVSSQTLTHLHTFEAEFTEQLYAAFRLWADDSSVSLCDVENNSRDRNT
ncbi:NACHT, LRR and PYD domains-containing protein 3-like [Aplochiton taeniatus]